MFNFGKALSEMEKGNIVSREGWNGKNMYLYIVSTELPYPPLSPNENWKAGIFEESKFVVMKTADDKLIPWLASQSDLLAEDWRIAE